MSMSTEVRRTLYDPSLLLLMSAQTSGRELITISSEISACRHNDLMEGARGREALHYARNDWDTTNGYFLALVISLFTKKGVFQF